MILGWGYTLKALKSTVQGTVRDDKLHLHKIISSQHCLEAIAKYYVFKDALPYFFRYSKKVWNTLLENTSLTLHRSMNSHSTESTSRLHPSARGLIPCTRRE